jgi:hypothetical protein
VAEIECGKLHSELKLRRFIPPVLVRHSFLPSSPTLTERRELVATTHSLYLTFLGQSFIHSMTDPRTKISSISLRDAPYTVSHCLVKATSSQLEQLTEVRVNSQAGRLQSF